MYFERFYDVPLAQASYLIGCQRTGEALVVDPNRDPAPYVAAAAREGLRITHVTETHIHADFVSGVRELAARTGARAYLSAEGGADWQYRWAAADGATLLRDGDHLMVGHVRVEAMHTPGHTPEHLAFVVTDTPSAAGPWGILTGDFVFVGDVGRPDLLEKAAGEAHTMEDAARTLFRSLARFRALPDHLQVWPGHGAGSACGKALGAVPSTTVGYEKRANWGVAAADEAAFVEAVLAGQPEPPAYFAEMKRVNRDGPPVLGRLPTPPHLTGDALLARLEAGAPVVDLRTAAAFADAHVPGTLHVPLNASFTTWAGWLLPYDRDVYLIAEAPQVPAAVRALALIGLDRVAGTATPDAALAAWRATGAAVGTVAQTTPDALRAAMARGEVAVVDVRGAAEWEAGHIPGVPNVPVGHLARRAAELPTDRPLVVHCQGGARSMIAASVLQRLGFTRVVDLAGGIAAAAVLGPFATGHDAEPAEGAALAGR
jgi:hydroxyacylglutathione hydrolase